MKSWLLVALAAALLPAAAGAQQGEYGEIDGTSPVARRAPAPKFKRNPIYPAQILIEGRLSLGYVRNPVEDAIAGVGPRGQIGSPTRSFLRLGGTETLDAGWLAQFRLEHSFDPSGGSLAGEDGRFWDAEATLGLSLRQGFRIDLGRKEQPAWRIVQKLDPWSGNTVASPDRWLYAPAPPPPVPSVSGPLPMPDRRSDQSATLSLPWDSPLRQTLAVDLQLAHAVDAGSPRGGGSLRYERGGWFIGVGFQEWRGGTRSLPLGLRYDAGTWTASAAVDRGRQPVDAGGTTASFDSAMLGATFSVMGKGDPQRREFLAALSSYAIEGRPRQWKLGAGYRYRLGPRTSFQVNAALARTNDPGTAGPVKHRLLDIGLVHLFSRDLRVPQEPW